MSNPLFDTLFRPTTVDRQPAVPGRSTVAAGPRPVVPPIASAAPVRTTGTRTRAGNAMSRTRTALLAGAGVTHFAVPAFYDAMIPEVLAAETLSASPAWSSASVTVA